MEIRTVEGYAIGGRNVRSTPLILKRAYYSVRISRT